MTDEERRQEGAEEPIEDLEAPARAQQDVTGGAACYDPSCNDADSNVMQVCLANTPSCKTTTSQGCMDGHPGSDVIVIGAL